jgi:hypothetical protein
LFCAPGYPLDFHEQVPVIPGGPRIHRTPVLVRPATSQRTQGTPHSVHSMRSLPQNATPASRRQATTPASAARPASSYPIPQDDTMGAFMLTSSLLNIDIRARLALHCVSRSRSPGTGLAAFKRPVNTALPDAGIIGGPKLMRTPIGGRPAHAQPLQELPAGEGGLCETSVAQLCCVL